MVGSPPIRVPPPAPLRLRLKLAAWPMLLPRMLLDEGADDEPLRLVRP